MRSFAFPVPLKRCITDPFGLCSSPSASRAKSAGITSLVFFVLLSKKRSVTMREAPPGSDHGQPKTAACRPRRSKRVQNGSASPDGRCDDTRTTGGMSPHARKQMPQGTIRKRYDGSEPLSGVRYEKRPATPWRYGSLPVTSEAHKAFGVVVGKGSRREK